MKGVKMIKADEKRVLFFEDTGLFSIEMPLYLCFL
jgi:hypothetical protein